MNFKAVRSYWVELGLGFGPKLLVRFSAKIGPLGKHMYIFGRFKSELQISSFEKFFLADF